MEDKWCPLSSDVLCLNSGLSEFMLPHIFWKRSQGLKTWLLASSYLSLRPSVRIKKSAPIKRIFIKIYIWVFLEKCRAEFKVHSNLTRIRRTMSELDIIIIIIIVEFFTSQLWLGNIHISWDAVINRIWLVGLTCSLKCFLQLLLLFSKLYNVSTSSFSHLTIILSSSSSYLCHSSLLPLIPFLPSVL